MKVRVLVQFDAELTDDLGQRQEAYGTVNPVECIQIDLDVDPTGFVLDNDMEVLSLTTMPEAEE